MGFYFFNSSVYDVETFIFDVDQQKDEKVGTTTSAEILHGKFRRQWCYASFLWREHTRAETLLPLLFLGFISGQGLNCHVCIVLISFRGN